MIYKYISFLALFFILQTGWSQKAVLQKANKAFKEKDFYTAIIAYKELDSLDRTLKINLADSYYQTGNMREAEKAYKEIYDVDPAFESEVLLRYADAAKANNNYDQANALLSQYAGKPVNIKQKLTKNSENLPLLLDVQLLDGGSDFTSFGPALLNNQLVFSSDRNMERPIYSRTNQHFLDLYTAEVNGNNLKNIKLFSEAINTPVHEGNAVFSKDGKTMYFTRTNDDFKRMDGVKVAVLQLFSATFADGKWQDVQRLPFNSNSYSLAHPALSADEKTLYFTSDMPGGFGEGDIYKIEILADNSFGNPENLGPMVNSELQEQFPYIDNGGNLYFASDRIEGLGGLDIYRSDKDGDTFAEAYNLGQGINSSRDDFSLIFEKPNASGFFSSNRNEIDKIYSFKAIDNRTRELAGIVVNTETKNPLKEAEITLKTAKNASKKLKTDGNGHYDFKVKPNNSYTLEARLKGFKTLSRQVVIDTNSELQVSVDLALEPLKDLLVKQKMDNIYFDYDQIEIRPEAEKTLNSLADFMLKNPEIRINIGSHTDAVGSSSYNNKLSAKRAKATKDYLIAKGIDGNRLTTEAYGKEHLLVETPAQGKGAREEKNRRSEFKIIEE